MQLYAGTSQQFIDDTVRNRISEKLRDSFFHHLRYQPSPNEVRSWQNSLTAMCNVLQYADLKDQGVVLEYQLPLSSRRLDCMLTGVDVDARPQAVIVELKQWDAASASAIDGCVTTYVGGRQRDVLHPSVQVGQYQQYLQDNQTVFTSQAVGIGSCSYLHNLQYDPASELFSARHHEALDAYPLFTGDQSPQLAEYVVARVGRGNGQQVLATVLESKYRPSKKLLEHTAAMIQGQQEYVLLDEQLVVFNAVLHQAREGFHAKQKAVLLVRGGPGTGKSVVALNLVGALAQHGYNAQHATGSRAFTYNIKRIVGSRAGGQFRFFNQFGDAERDAVDILVADEAHRIRKNSNNRFTSSSKRSTMAQVDELVQAAKVSVFFIDDLQIVRPGEEGSSVLIREAAARNGAALQEFELEAQFRCSGSDAFINWIDNTLGIRRTANTLWDASDAFEFRIIDSVQELEATIRERNAHGNTARLSAGFCWPWSDPRPDGTLVDDVRVDSWSMPWNAKTESGRLATGIPASHFWASQPGGVNQVGCVYTAQGFEYDYAGVIFGRDLRYDPRTAQWVGNPRVSYDTVVKRANSGFVDLVKHTYRVLLTRGMKGCFVYFMDDDTRNFFRSRMECVESMKIE